MSTRALGILAGFAADRLLGDPRRFHPVAGFGSLATALERRLYGQSRARGVVHALTLVGGVAVVGAGADRMAGRPVARTLLTAAATWAVLGGRSLEQTAAEVHRRLAAGDLPGSRRQLGHLVGRDTHDLDESEIARAAIESVAENTSDAVVAPLVWGVIAGVPGLVAYRAVNTLDAMVGHRNARYDRFGWAAAKLDDLVNLPGARLCGLLTLAADPRHAWRAWVAWRRDASAHPSPNAGVVEAAFAGALGLRLGGTNRYYGDRIEHRPHMGDGRAAQPHDIGRANRLARRVGFGAAAVCTAAAVALSRRR